jgi:hypothetical protein
MAPALDADKANQDARAAYLRLREAFGSETYRQTVEWLEALTAQQQAHMAACGKDKLADAQTRLKQLRALLEALAPKDPAGTGHVFD